ncbi:hypothetical protein DR71_649 [Corynebacterium sp. ATCC 6931]|nr:hypothetical protein DR71_649 [Corynebacterium sp. ATCC 6931]
MLTNHGKRQNSRVTDNWGNALARGAGVKRLRPVKGGCFATNLALLLQWPCRYLAAAMLLAALLLLGSVAVVQNPVDSASQTTDVLRVDGREHTDA